MADLTRAGEMSTVARTRPWLLVAAAAIGWGLATITILHLISSHNPALDTLSTYAFTNRGTGMLAVSILLIALGSVAVFRALRVAGVPMGRFTPALFLTWSGGLTLAAAFPASYEKHPNPMSGEIHQYSALVAFLSLPAIGFTIADRLRAIPALARHRAAVRRWAMLSAGSLIPFGVSYVLTKFPNSGVVAELSAALPVGVAQRLTLVADIVLLLSLLALAAATALLYTRRPNGEGRHEDSVARARAGEGR